jgi:alkanesulfonate monooxygenase SsuD/methylene tetrahydromethanopterin reductase-like flavin-dependent oxidoreductase (luciferase family)
LVVAPARLNGGMETPASFAIAAPQHVPPSGFVLGAFRDYLQEAESLGFAGAWVGEQVIGTAPTLAPLEVLALASGCTESLRLGTAALISTVHSPLHLAQAVASLDHLSGGRVELGVAGGGYRRPFAAFGVTAEGWARRYAEGIELIRAAWTQKEVSFDGRWFQADGLPVEPKPVQRPHPPLWMGGNAPSAVRRAVRMADGFFGAGSTTTAAFADQVAVARTALEGADRKKASFRIAKRIYIAVDDEADLAWSRVLAGLDRLYGWFGLTDLSSVAVAGTPQDCVAGIRAVIEAGAQLVLLDPIDDDPVVLRRLAAVVDEVRSL